MLSLARLAFDEVDERPLPSGCSELLTFRWFLLRALSRLHVWLGYGRRKQLTEDLLILLVPELHCELP